MTSSLPSTGPYAPSGRAPRRRQGGARNRRSLFGAAAAVMVIAVTMAGCASADLSAPTPSPAATQAAPTAAAAGTESPSAEANAESCWGAAALAHYPEPCEAPTVDEALEPDPASAKDDTAPSIYNDDCRAKGTVSQVKSCTFGDPDGSVRVALLGDSHAAAWFPAAEKVALDNGWRLDVYYKSACAFNSGYPRTEAATRQSCIRWNRTLNDLLASDAPYDIALTSFRNKIGDITEKASIDAFTGGFTESWQPLLDRGTRVVAITDTPFVAEGTLQCFEESGYDAEECALTPQNALLPVDLMAEAAAATPGVELLDFTRYFCTEDICPLIIGNVVVYRDLHHMTATFSRSLAPFLEQELLS